RERGAEEVVGEVPVDEARDFAGAGGLVVHDDAAASEQAPGPRQDRWEVGVAQLQGNIQEICSRREELDESLEIGIRLVVLVDLREHLDEACAIQVYLLRVHALPGKLNGADVQPVDIDVNTAGGRSRDARREHQR